MGGSFGACWPASLTESLSFRISERPCLKPLVESDRGKSPVSASGLYMHAHTWACALVTITHQKLSVPQNSIFESFNIPNPLEGSVQKTPPIFTCPQARQQPTVLASSCICLCKVIPLGLCSPAPLYKPW